MGSEPHQVRIDAGQFVHQNPHPLRFGRDLQAKQFLDRQTVSEIVGHRAEVVDAVGERHYLLVKLCFASLLDAGVQIANLRLECRRPFRRQFRARGAAHHGSTDAADPCSVSWSGRRFDQHCARRVDPRPDRQCGWEICHDLPVTFHGIVLPQGMALPVIGHHDAFQVGVSGETHAK